ncbi:MAG: DUF4391 domain-containing protein [Erysipelotrichia bacterium]|jgi:hypothetical protein|nr:DUF4391 domain-containing protein [Erysipelotrichia bacterium]
MFSLPTSTEYNKIIPKKHVLSSESLNITDRKLIENEISKLTIINVIDAEKIRLFNIKDSFPLVIIHVQTKSNEYNPKISEALFKGINQTIILFYSLSTGSFFTTKRAGTILTSQSQPISDWNFKLTGTSIQEVWDNLCIDIFKIKKVRSKSIDESIILNAEIQKMEESIQKLEDKARKEIQPRRKRQLAEDVMKLRKELREKMIYD